MSGALTNLSTPAPARSTGPHLAWFLHAAVGHHVVHGNLAITLIGGLVVLAGFALLFAQYRKRLKNDQSGLLSAILVRYRSTATPRPKRGSEPEEPFRGDLL